MSANFYFCKCFYSCNIYIRQYDKHFTFENETQFLQEYGKFLSIVGCGTVEEQKELLNEIKAETQRRQSIESTTIERMKHLQRFYQRPYNDVYILKDKHFDSKFLALVERSKISNYTDVIQMVDVISDEKQLYGFPVFTDAFCDILIQELQHYEQSTLPKGRPNSMNKYGVLLDELGFYDNFSQTLRKKYLDPLAEVLFPDLRNEGLDSHKIFTVSYRMNEDLDLGYHYDNSEVTLNVCLGKSFQGGELYFGDMRTVPVSESTCVIFPHKKGYAIFHRGQQLHGALPITSGERHNLIVWLRASSVRNRLCPMCNAKPKLFPSALHGDGFTLGEQSSTEICSVV